jgi:hypothetical protein
MNAQPGTLENLYDRPGEVGLKGHRTVKERGSSLAWMAIFLSAVVLPLILLVAEGSRWFIIRGRLQTATDAACEDAAWSSADVRAFRRTGKITFANLSETIPAAQNTFQRTLSSQEMMGYSASLSIFPDPGAALMACTGTASVRPSFGKSHPLQIVVHASSAIRFTR